jgi:hypothetical protein
MERFRRTLLQEKSSAGATGATIVIRDLAEAEMREPEITLRDILQAIVRMTDAEVIQLKSAARREMERRNLKLSRHSAPAPAPARRIA